jgi:hypothetical protein
MLHFSLQFNFVNKHEICNFFAIILMMLPGTGYDTFGQDWHP